MSYVALKEGDEVGVMTFGTEPGGECDFAARKGMASLNALMARVYDIQPGPVHSDYLAAARRLMTAYRKRSLVVLLTNFRGEDAAELQPALRLMRTRHLVMVASLREQVLGEMMEQAVDTVRQSVEVAGAHYFEQARHQAFARCVGRDALSLDVEPADLPVSLVNRYHAVKTARML
jgi:uncharacterized protein (DUF58 family)